jgi:alpha-tubulin suppressor-like RCC1 family protein
VQVVSGDCSLSGVTAIAAGSYFSLALKTDGTVRAWGLNNVGQLGDGTTTFVRLTPVQVQNLSGVTAIAAGFAHSLALRTNGFVQAWGFNDFGQLGDGSTIERDKPVTVGNLSGVTAIAAGSNFNLAVSTSGALLTVNKILVHPDQIIYHAYSICGLMASPCGRISTAAALGHSP